MKDIDFFLQYGNNQYNGIWLDRCASNPPDSLEWRTILELIINKGHLGKEGIIAVTFAKRTNIRKADNEYWNVNHDRMINMMSEILMHQQPQQLQQKEEFPYTSNHNHSVYIQHSKYQICFIHSKSYNKMCTMWWKLNLTPVFLQQTKKQNEN